MILSTSGNLLLRLGLPPQLLKAMKLTIFFLTAAFLQVHARSYSQVTLSLKDAPIEKVFREIERQTGYGFLYTKKMLDDAAKITIDVKNAPVIDVLNQCFKGQPLEYSMDNNTIVITRKTPPVILSASEESPSPLLTDISGRITDPEGHPLEGANVKVKGTGNGTTTNADGMFILKNVEENGSVEISFVGYETQFIAVKNRTSISLVLKRSENPLDDVQVIAYGQTTQRLNTGDVTTVTSKEIEKQPVGNVLAALEGRVPGLVINQTSGVPGGAFTVQIRGQNSMLNGNDPFYVVDGVPYASQTLGNINNNLKGNYNLNGGNQSYGNPLNYINPSDIESITVLKDADATSIYGSRAANGAILITTKKGKGGALKVDLNVYAGIGHVTREMDLLNTPQYLQMRNEAFSNDNETPTQSNAPDLLVWDTTRYTNWQKTLIGNTSHYTDAQASVSGGNEYTQYLLGGGYHRETTVYPGSTADQKASVHFNINTMSLNKRFKVNFSASYLSGLNNVPPNDLTGYAFSLAPDAPPLYNSDGTLNWAPITPDQSGTWTNPASYLFFNYKGRTSNLVSNSVLSYILFRGFDLKVSMGYTNTQTGESLAAPAATDDPGYYTTSSYIGYSSFNNANSHSWIIEPQANYKVNLGKGVFSALIGMTFQQSNADRQTLYATGFSSDALLENIQAATSITVQSIINSVYKYNAFFGRFNYNWQDKYLLTLTARRDGSSRFGPENQFANFGAVGAAWIFSKEKLFQNNQNLLSFGKLKVSYGTSGNDQVGDYRFLDLYGATRYPYQGMQGLFPTNLFNPNLAWELNKKLEAGIELGFLRDRIMIQANYYQNRSNNQLITAPLSLVTGFNSIPENLPALVQNSGIEAMLQATIFKTNNFSWNCSINLTIPKNKLISFPDLANSPYKNLYIVGQPVTIIKAYHYLDVNDSTGVYEFATSKGVPSYDPNYIADANVLINTAPELYGGFENSFQYKGFQLDVLFQFVKQTAQNIYGGLYNPPGFSNSNQPNNVLDRWQKPGDLKPYQQYTQSYSSNAYNSYSSYYQYSDAIYTDASFIRLKNLSFSYTIPESLNHKMHIQNCRIYIHGQNLLTITKYLGLDPETQGSVLPPLRVWAAGFQITL